MQTDYQAQKEQLARISNAVASLLNGQCRQTQEQWLTHIVLSDGLELSLSIRDGRLVVQPVDGNLAPYKKYGEVFPSISVSAARPPAHIAREIERRLLPEARERFIEMRLRKQEEDEARAVTRRNAAIFTELIGSQAQFDDADCRARIWATSPWPWLKVEVRKDQVALEIRSLTQEQAMAMLSSLREHLFPAGEHT